MPNTNKLDSGGAANRFENITDSDAEPRTESTSRGPVAAATINSHCSWLVGRRVCTERDVINQDVHSGVQQ